tara:strand:+ start:10965 stop:12107 length:1143 start_codon:yes stop_codon:yes gene_type:complete
MKITYKSIDNFLILFLMIAIVMPTSLAKLLIILAFFLISLRIIKINKISFGNTKIIILALITPGIMLTALNSTQELLRFVVILILLLGFPFTGFRFNKKLIMNFCSLILIYLIFTQIFIGLEVDWLISFRGTWYPHEYASIFDWQAFINLSEDKSISEIIGKYRLGGLFYNPNVLGIVVLLYFFIFDACYLKKENKNKFIYLFIFLIVLFSLFLTFSRTAITGLIIYYFIKNVNYKKFLFFRIEKRSLLILILVILMVIYMFEPLKEGLMSAGSGGQKFDILIKYLASADPISIFFGGVHDTQYRSFDADLGNWIGAVGLVGILGIIFFLRKIVITNNLTKPFVITLIIMSIGNTVLYGLLSASIVFCYFIIISDIEKQT